MVAAEANQAFQYWALLQEEFHQNQGNHGQGRDHKQYWLFQVIVV